MFRSTKINGYMKAMRRLGITEQQFLEGTGIAPEQVSNPEYLVSLEQYSSVVSNMMRLTGNPGIGFSLADLADITDFGIVGYAILSSNSLRQVLDVWVEYGNSLVGIPLNIDSIRQIHPGFELMLSTPSKMTALHRFMTEEGMVQGKKMVRDVTGVEPQIGKVWFSYPEPPHRALYEEFCQCPIEFDAPQTVVRYLTPELDAPTQIQNEELLKICAEHCGGVMRASTKDDLLRSRIRSLFLASPGRLPDLNDASAALGMASSTLRLHLDRTGQSYQAIKHEFRFDLAREYLLSGHMAMKQVAYLLGYNSPSAFCRAFKGWTGQTVNQFLKTGVDSKA